MNIENKEKKNLTKDKIELQHLHWGGWKWP